MTECLHLCMIYKNLFAFPLSVWTKHQTESRTMESGTNPLEFDHELSYDNETLCAVCLNFEK